MVSCLGILGISVGMYDVVVASWIKAHRMSPCILHTFDHLNQHKYKVNGFLRNVHGNISNCLYNEKKKHSAISNKSSFCLFIQQKSILNRL